MFFLQLNVSAKSVFEGECAFSKNEKRVEKNETRPTCNCNALPSYDLTFLDGDVLTTAQTFTNKKIEVSGTLTINANITFDRCTLYVNTWGVIDVLGIGSLTAKNKTVFRSCTSGNDNKWNGITTKGRKINFSGVAIQNAEYGITFEPVAGNTALNYSTTRLDKVDFSDNRTCIYIGDPFSGNGGAPLNFTPAYFSLNSFQTGTQDYGIQIFNCRNFRMSGTNFFTNMINGILSFNSTLTIIGASFTAMNCVQVGCSQTGGTYLPGFGITANESNVIVRNCKFTNNVMGGVHSRNTKTGIEVSTNCKFSASTNAISTLGKYGIFVEQSTNMGYIRINNNSFEMGGYKELSAISVERMPNDDVNFNNSIKDNKITVNAGDHGYKSSFGGIITQGRTFPNLIEVIAKSPAKDRFPITLNKIYIKTDDSPINGILLHGASDRFELETNTVNYENTSAPTDISNALGISAINCAGVGNLMKKGNSVKASYFSPDSEDLCSQVKCGIHIQDSPGWVVCSNSADKTRRGFHFDGANDFCDFANNTINTHFHGVECINSSGGNTSDMGDQNFHDNIWLGSPSGLLSHAKYTDILAIGTSTAIQNPAFVFRNEVGFEPSVVIPDADWFIGGFSMIDCRLFNTTCSVCEHPLPPVIEKPTEGDIKIINGTYFFPYPSAQWDGERKLLGKLIENPQWRPAGSDAALFFTQEQNSSTFAFATAEKSFENAFRFPASISSRYLNWVNLSDQYINELEVLDSLLQNFPTSSNVPTWEANRDANLSNSTIAWDSLTVIHAEITPIKSGKLASAQSLAAALPQTTPYESDFRTMLLMKIKLAGGGVLTQSEKDALHFMGEQCPSTNGEIVRYAPLLLPIDEARKYVLESHYEHCLNSAAQLRQAQNVPKKTFESEIWSAFPNPTADEVTIQFAQKTTGNWTVYDLSGHSVLTGSLPSEQKMFVIRGLSHFGDGVYSLTFINSEGKLLSRSITVLH